MRKNLLFSLIVLFLVACPQQATTGILGSPKSVALHYMEILQKGGEEKFGREHNHYFRNKVRDMRNQNPEQIWKSKEKLMWDERKNNPAIREGLNFWRERLAAGAIEHIETRDLKKEECLEQRKNENEAVDCPTALVFIKVSYVLSERTPFEYKADSILLVKEEYYTINIFEVEGEYELGTITRNHLEEWSETETKEVRSIIERIIERKNN